MLSKLLAAAQVLDASRNHKKLSYWLCSEGAGIEFLTVQELDLPDPEIALRDPDGVALIEVIVCTRPFSSSWSRGRGSDS